jgi:glycosyltransferase involved in cell wall biosynthesis
MRVVRRLAREILAGYRRARSAAWVIKQENCGAILACSGDPFDLPAGYLASLCARVPFYAYLFDDYMCQWNNTPYYHLARIVEPFILKGAAGVAVPNEFLSDTYQLRYRVEPTVIHNALEVPKTERNDAPLWSTNRTEARILYTGSVYHAHYDAFRNLIAAIRRLDRMDVKLHLYTSQTQEELEREDIVGPVVHHEPLAPSKVFEVQRRADILFLPLAFDSKIPEVVRTSSPGKMGEYLASGQPILVHAPPASFVSWYFRKHECGVVVDENRPEVLKLAIQRLLEDTELRREIGENARARAIADFDLVPAQAKFLKLLQAGTEG